jgi:caffeoyl-CoA O-methyltransferase
MSSSLGLSPEIVAYLAAANPSEHSALARCRAETAGLGRIAGMQISAEQGAVMQMLARLVNAKRVFEVGVFTGYSSTALALTLKELHAGEGNLLACDVSEEWTGKARSYWKEAGVESLIDLQIRPATETLKARIAGGEAGAYDFGFIDADKVSYPAYYEAGLELLRPGGIMLFDNVLWSGKVANPADRDEDTEALRAVAQKAKADVRVHAAMAGIGDGLLIVMKR